MLTLAAAFFFVALVTFVVPSFVATVVFASGAFVVTATVVFASGAFVVTGAVEAGSNAGVVAGSTAGVVVSGSEPFSVNLASVNVSLTLIPTTAASTTALATPFSSATTSVPIVSSF